MKVLRAAGELTLWLLVGTALGLFIGFGVDFLEAPLMNLDDLWKRDVLFFLLFVLALLPVKDFTR